MRVLRHQAETAPAWNAFNAGAINGHFLFDRGFMDYHADRFADASLIIEHDGAIAALLPANRSGGEVWSHQGLTFGGLIHAGLATSSLMAALDACAEALARDGASALVYKALPSIYAQSAAEADRYWLYRRNASRVRCEVSAAIDYRAPGPRSGRRARGARKAERAGLAFAGSQDWAGYWAVLEAVLAERHAAAPTHTLAEIKLLAERFPQHISLHLATRGSAILAGVVLFVSAQVAHAQYIAASPEGREVGALDGLMLHLIEGQAGRRRYFDFGVSTTDGGRRLNEGLMRQKEEFGAGAVVHETYRVGL